MKQLTLALSIFSLALVGCNVADKQTNVSNNSAATNKTSNTAANTAGKNADANKEVAAAFENLKSQPSVIAKVDSAGPDTKYDQLIEAAGAEKVRRVFIYAGDFVRTPSDTSEELQVGKDIFFKRPSGEWVKAAYNSPVFDNMIPRPLSAFDFTPADDETLDGKPVSVYTLTGVSPELPKGGKGKVWILKDKKIPVKALFELPNGPTTTYTYDFNTPIKPIEAPKGKIIEG